MATRDTDTGTEVLLIRRGQDPCKGMLAFPGGFVEYGEDPEDAVRRELLEETGIVGTNPVSIAVHGEPTRDPRKHVIALFYRVQVDPDSVPTAGDDASEAYWIPLNQVTEQEIAGDHILIINMLRE